MNAFLIANAQALVNSVGLLFDIAGACLVAWEVVVQFEGKRLNSTTGVAVQTGFGEHVVVAAAPEESQEFKIWEQIKYKRMKLGLGLLVFGFALQLTSNWVPLLLHAAGSGLKLA